VVEDIDATVPLDGIEGFACDGALSDTLSQFQPIMPMSCDAGGDTLTIASNQQSSDPIP
jgi:hypothetical protein